MAEYKVEPTEGQKKAFEIIAKQKLTGKVNKGQALKEAGYSDYVAKAPSIVLESRGYKQLVEAEIPQATLISYLKKDLELKEGNRLPEIKYAMELHGVNTNKVDLTYKDETDADLLKLKALIDKVEREEKE